MFKIFRPRCPECGTRLSKGISYDTDNWNNYSTMYRELDANDEGAKLGVDTLYPLIRACIPFPFVTVPPPVIWINSKCGFKALPIKAEPVFKDVRDEELEDLQAIAKFQQGIRDKLPVEKLVEIASSAQSEIDATMELYRRQCEGK